MKSLRVPSLSASLLLPLLLLVPQGASGQVHGKEGAEASAETEPPVRHRLALFVGNTLVPEDTHTGAVDGLIISPTIGFDYSYWPSQRLGLAWINDFQLDRYVVELGDGSELERELLYVTSLVLSWRATHRFELFAGPGVETDANETLALFKLGGQWEMFQTESRDVAFNVSWDVKDGYDAWAIGFSIGRLWR